MLIADLRSKLLMPTDNNFAFCVIVLMSEAALLLLSHSIIIYAVKYEDMFI